jgi:peptidoglycan/LPS O-acetylase OafA/YrhL
MTAATDSGARYAPLQTDRLWSRPLKGHIPALDGIRGLAILLVLIHHYGNSANGMGVDYPLPFVRDLAWMTVDIGWMGVDLFFVLSGFLITGILYEAKGTDKYFKNFYIRRALRIFPLYYAAIGFIILLKVFWPDGGSWGTASAWWQALYATNFLIIFQGDEAAGILAHYWSLAIEEHFYLMWPLLVFLGSRRQIMGAAVAVVVGAIVVRLLLFAYDAPLSAAYVLTFAKMDSLAVGALVALAARGHQGLAPLVGPARIVLAAGLAALTAIVLVGGGESDGLLFRTFGYTVVSLTCGAIIVVGLTTRWLDALLAIRPLTWLGKYSYGLYVWHPITNVIVFYTSVRGLFGSPDTGRLNSLLVLGTALALTFIVAWLSYNLFEKRFLALKDRLAPEPPRPAANVRSVDVLA